MIVGTGMIGSRFQSRYSDRRDVLIFASGVSDSREQRPEAFQRELDLIQHHVAQLDEDCRFVYFSTISIHDPSRADNRYQQHKKGIEEYLSNELDNYLIIRSPNVTGQGGNNANLLNFLYEKIKTGAPFEVWEHAERNILDVRDFFTLVDALIQKEPDFGTIDLVYPYSYTILEIVAVLEACLLKRAQCKVVNKGASYVPDPSDEIRELYRETGVYVNQDYLTRVIKQNFDCRP